MVSVVPELNGSSIPSDGWEAYWEGFDLDDNPCEKFSNGWWLWQCDWHDAEAMEEMSREQA
jgi:hypothetical protein